MPLAVPLRAKAAALDLPALMAALAAVPERRSVFRETRTFAALDQPLISQGHLIYRRPDYLEKITDWPLPERLVVDKERLILTEGNDPPRVVELSRAPELRVLVDAIRGPLSGNIEALRRAFRIGAGGSMAAWTLDLTPADPAAARLLRTVRIAGVGDALREITLTQANGDVQRMAIDP